MAALAILVLVRPVGNDGSPSIPDATPSPAPAVTSVPAAPRAFIEVCPVDAAICDFGTLAESWVRDGQAERLIAAGTAWDNPDDRAKLQSALADDLRDVAWPVRLASIGCPIVEVHTCAEAFSLTFTTLSPRERTAPGISHSMLTLGFARRPGSAPAISRIAVPEGDDRWFSVGGGRGTNCALSGANLPGNVCTGVNFFAVEVEYPVLKGEPPRCPALKVVCETALAAEARLKRGDFAALAGSSRADALEADIVSNLGSDAPRLIAVACPFGDVRADCTGPFAAAFTTLSPEDDWTVGGKLVVLRYDWSPGGPVFRDVVALEDADSREGAIRGGFATKPCDIAGVAPGNRCTAATFVRYWSQEPFEVRGAPEAVRLQVRPAAPPPANSTIFTAVARCWACDEPDTAIQRHVVDARGNVATTTVLESSKGPLEGWTMGQVAHAAPDGSVLAVVVCDLGYCGALGGQKPEATWRVVWSKDGGVTWTEAFRARTEYLEVTSLSASGFIAVAWKSNPGGALQTVYAVHGTEVRVVQPPAGLPARPDATFMPDGSIAWIPLSEDGLVVGGLRAEDGSRLSLALPAGAQYPEFGTLADGRVWASWYQFGRIVGIFAAPGTLEALVDAGDVFRPELITAETGIGTVATAGVDGSVPALLDLTAGTVTPLGAPFGETLTGRNRVLAVIPANR